MVALMSTRFLQASCVKFLEGQSKQEEVHVHVDERWDNSWTLHIQYRSITIVSFREDWIFSSSDIVDRIVIDNHTISKRVNAV